MRNAVQRSYAAICFLQNLIDVFGRNAGATEPCSHLLLVRQHFAGHPKGPFVPPARC